MSAVDLTIDELAFDLKNPRFDGLTSQREALEKILLTQGRKLVNLAEDIVTEGLSPGSRMLTAKGKDGKYIALDGNRRLAALRILANPAVLDGVNDVGSLTKRQFKRLAELFDRSVVEPINAWLCEDVETARHWIEAIHTGENDGRGVVNWDGVMRARFRGQSASLKVLDLVKKRGRLTEDEDALLERFPITNLDRLLGTIDVRERLGLQMEDGELYTDVPAGDVIRVLKRIVLDLATKKIRVSKIHNKVDRVKYVDSLGKDLPDLSKRTGKEVSIESLTTGGAAAAAARAAAAKRRSQVNRRSLFRSDFKPHIDSPKVDEIARELRKLPIESYPNAVGTLARVFIELSMDHFGSKNLSKWSIDDSLKAKIGKVADELQARGAHKRELQPFRRLASAPDGALSVDRLHGVIHSRYELPKPDELRRAWDEVAHVFARIWSPPPAVATP